MSMRSLTKTHVFPEKTITVHAHSGDVMEMLGLKRGGHLPDEGMPARVIQGIKVWVEPTPGPKYDACWGRPRKSSAHRVMCECPDCGKHMSVGRLHQHVCKDKRQPQPEFDLYWSPEGKKIATVKAKNARLAIRKAPAPYRKFLGEIYAQLAPEKTQ